MVIIPHSRAAATPFNTFGELPLVLMAMAMSPFRPWARTWRAKSRQLQRWRCR
jgi:hypothetical protein